MARPAVATQTPSTLAAATATGSHIPAMVSRRRIPGITHGLAIASDALALAWPANNSDNAAACAFAQRRTIPRLHSAAILQSSASLYRNQALCLLKIDFVL